MAMADFIIAPWTQAQVDNLNQRQQREDLHPYTCGIDSSHHPVLLATVNGWRCPADQFGGCLYSQNWAHTIDGLGTSIPEMSQLLTSSQVAEMLHITEEGLRRWRYRGKGPPFLRLGPRTLRYRPEDVQTWLEQQTDPPTIEKERIGS